MSRHLTVVTGSRRPDALVPGRHPVLFDRAEHPDVLVIPAPVHSALRVLVAAAHASGSAPMVEAADIVGAHFLSRAANDDAPAHGYPRPS